MAKVANKGFCLELTLKIAQNPNFYLHKKFAKNA